MRTKKDIETITLQYCKDIKSGKIPSCVYVKKATARFQRVLKNPPTEYMANWEKLSEIINFAESLYIPDIGKKLELLPWMFFAYAGIFLFTKKDNPKEFLVRIAYIEVARKNSKTTSLLFPTILYNFLATDNAESYFFSGDEMQAKKSFAELKNIVKDTPQLKEVCTVWTNSIVFKNSKISFFTSGTKKLDSYKNSYAILDEYHEYYTDKPLQASLQGMRARKEGGQAVIITTAGTDVTKPCYLESQEAKKMLKGTNKDDETYFALIYTLDKDDDWKDPNNLAKANPSIDLITKRKALEADLKRAVDRPSTQNNFLAKTYNIWSNDKGSNWIPPEVWIKQAKKKSDYKEKSVYIAIDLSKINDLTVVTLYWKDNKYYYAHHLVYIPEQTITERIIKENINYAEWIESGLLKIIPGATIDFDFLVKDLASISTECDIIKIAYDPWHASSLISALQTEIPGNIPLIEFRQNLANFSEPTKLFEKNILDRKIIDPNPMMLWNLGNVAVKPDANDNYKPLKNTPDAKIDIVVTSIMAHYLLISDQKENQEIYDFNDLMGSI